ncbi:hypothetical protein Ga0100231_013680 [Opitutaceae bacterium TAV4]|nr:hypothetical protein Ga0100231_013680 [Opitutaceae bacterium TAV4]RRJ99460.1 hypothetical protein Ga0100230_015030 [Opitutaceae bacterium TAV3]
MNILAFLSSALSAWIDPLIVRFRIIETYYPHLTALALCAVKTAAIVLLAWTATKLLRRQSARARCWVWRCAMPGLLAVLLPIIAPVVTERIRLVVPLEPQQGQQEKAYAQIRDWGLLPPDVSHEIPGQNHSGEHTVRNEPTTIANQTGVAVPPIPANVTLPFWRQADVRVWPIWSSGAALLTAIWLLRLGAGIFWLRRGARTAAPEVLRTVLDVARELRVSATPCVWHNTRVTSPLLTGWLRPHIHLPSETVTGTWTVHQLRMVFLHEFAHWKRMDTLWLHLGRLASLAFWWNPLVAFAARRMMREAEEAADDIVLLHQPRQQPTDYASTLVSLASSASAAPARCLSGLSMIGRKPLETRIRALLRPNPRRGRIGWKAATLTVLLAMFSLATITVFVTRSHAENPPPASDEFIPARKLTAGERSLLQAIVDANERRLAALRYVHLIEEKRDTHTVTDHRTGSVFKTENVKSLQVSELWSDTRRYIGRALRGSSYPDSRPDSYSAGFGEIKTEATIYHWTMYPYGNFKIEAIKRDVLFQDSYVWQLYDLNQKIILFRQMLETGLLDSGREPKEGGKSYELDRITTGDRPLVRLRINYHPSKDSPHNYQLHLFFDPADEYLLRRYEHHTEGYDDKLVWETVETARTPSGILYHRRYKYTYRNGNQDFVLTLLEPLDALPASVFQPPASPGAEFVSENETQQQPARITFRFVNNDNGTPVPGAKTEVSLDTETWNKPIKTAADALGQIAVPLPAEPLQFLKISCSADGFASYSIRWDRKGNPLRLPDTHTIRLVPVAPLSGRVLDEDNAPVAGAEVTVDASGILDLSDEVFRGKTVTRAPVKTDSSGRWTFPFAPRDMRAVAVSVTRPEYEKTTEIMTTGFPVPSEAAFAPLRDGSHVLVLKQGARLSGLVTDSAGAPVANCTITLGRDIHGTNLPTATTGKDGRFSLSGLENSAVLLTAEAPGLKPHKQELTPPFSDALRITLQPGRVIRGRVVTPEGKPSVNTRVSLDTWVTEETVWRIRTLRFITRTDADGRFEWTGAPDEPVTFVFQWNDCRELLCGLPLSPSPEEQLIVAKPALHVTGTVVDSISGNPVKNIKVTPGRHFAKHDSVSWDTVETKSWSDGRFEWETPYVTDGHIFRIEATGYAPLQTRVYPTNQDDITETFRLQPVK